VQGVQVSYDQSKVAFVDTETAGLDPEWHGIWEIAVIIDGEEHCWQQQIDLMTVDPWVWENTGIDDRYDDETALPWQESIARFRDLVGDRHLVGACPWFDSQRLHRLWLTVAPDDKRALPWHYHLIDVENLAVGYLRGQLEPYKEMVGVDPPQPHHAKLPWSSDGLSRMLGVEPDNFGPKHSALADARWVKALYEAIMGAPA
jgi:hypothetical protein